MKKLMLVLLIGMCFISFASAFNWSDNSILHYYDFNQTVGTDVPDIVSGNDLTTTNGPTWETGILGNALKFDGTQFALSDTNINLTGAQNRTISFWANLSNITHYNAYLDFGTSGALEKFFPNTFANLNTLSFFGSDNPTTQASELDWHFHVITYNGTGINYWYDNVSIFNLTVALNTGSSILELAESTFQSTFLEGSMDELMFVNRTLSNAEIGELWNGGIGLQFNETPTLNVTLNTPVDSFSSVFNEISFNSTVDILNASLTIINVSLLIDSVIIQTNTSGIEGNYIFNESLATGEHNWSVSVTATNDVIVNSLNRSVTAGNFSFGMCNATLTVPYINFTFKNETTDEESVNATIDSVWNFWISTEDQSTAQQFTFTNSSENPLYSFCGSPGEVEFNSNVTLIYNNADSQQRVFVSEPILTNVTTSQVLYLLPSTLGLFGQFQTRDIANNPISLVKGLMSRTLGGSTVNTGSSFTDSSGIVIFFLNPDVLYTATFSKEGFLNNIFTFFPTTDLRFVTMGTGASVNGSNISIGTLYEITPLESSLTNNTNVTFGFNVSGEAGINFISMNITNGNGTSFGFNSTTGIGFISLIINTSSNQTLVGIFEIRTGDENMTISKIWNIATEFQGDYSISKQGELFLQYEFSDFIRLMMVIFIIFGIVIFMSSNELADNNESKIAVIVLLIWGFSAIGWLDNPAVVSTTGIAQYGRQYGIAILSTAGALYFFMRRIFI